MNVQYLEVIGTKREDERELLEVVMIPCSAQGRTGFERQGSLPLSEQAVAFANNVRVLLLSLLGGCCAARCRCFALSSCFASPPPTRNLSLSSFFLSASSLHLCTGPQDLSCCARVSLSSSAFFSQVVRPSGPKQKKILWSAQNSVR